MAYSTRVRFRVAFKPHLPSSRLRQVCVRTEQLTDGCPCRAAILTPHQFGLRRVAQIVRSDRAHLRPGFGPCRSGRCLSCHPFRCPSAACRLEWRGQIAAVDCWIIEFARHPLIVQIDDGATPGEAIAVEEIPSPTSHKEGESDTVRI